MLQDLPNIFRLVKNVLFWTLEFGFIGGKREKKLAIWVNKKPVCQDLLNMNKLSNMKTKSEQVSNHARFPMEKVPIVIL